MQFGRRSVAWSKRCWQSLLHPQSRKDGAPESVGIGIISENPKGGSQPHVSFPPKRRASPKRCEQGGTRQPLRSTRPPERTEFRAELGADLAVRLFEGVRTHRGVPFACIAGCEAGEAFWSSHAVARSSST